MAQGYATPVTAPVAEVERRTYTLDIDRFLVPLGRALFAWVFLVSGLHHFTQPAVDAAALQGVPYPEYLVPLAGLMAFMGGVMLLFGWETRVGASLLVLFLIPVTLIMHDYWNVDDPVAYPIQQAMFMKNVALLGAAFFMAYMGGGPISVDAAMKAARADALR
ncbi:MAG: DoxX family protein [bacterium]